MCTSISLSTPVPLSGRNMDIESAFGEQVVITPRNYPFSFRNRLILYSHFAMIGMAAVAQGVPLYAEAANEKGLYMAGLHFPDNAFYFPPSGELHQTDLTPYELIPFILGSCRTVEEAKQQLERIRLLQIPFSQTILTAPLHWHIADGKRSIVAEPMKDGLKIYENPVGVLTNNPPFPYHLMNLHNYQALSSQSPKNHFSSSLDLKNLRRRDGGDRPAGRCFPHVKIYQSGFSGIQLRRRKEPDRRSFPIFSHPRFRSNGSRCVITSRGNHDITTYSCCIDIEKGIYYYKTYSNHQITAVHLFHENLDCTELKAFPLMSKEQIFYLN